MMRFNGLASSLLLVALAAPWGCGRDESTVPAVAEARTPLLYEPNPVFYTLACADAQEVVLWDLGREDRPLERYEWEAYARVLRSRYEACHGSDTYVESYMELLQIVGWSGTYNRVLADERVEWTRGRPAALPESTLTASRTEP